MIYRDARSMRCIVRYEFALVDYLLLDFIYIKRAKNILCHCDWRYFIKEAIDEFEDYDIFNLMRRPKSYRVKDDYMESFIENLSNLYCYHKIIF